MIPITYRLLDIKAEINYIDKVLSCIDDPSTYSNKIKNIITKMQLLNKPLASRIKKNAVRFQTEDQSCMYLYAWLVMPYEDVEEVKKYLSDIIQNDLKKINQYISSNKLRNKEIKSYNDLLYRRKLNYKSHPQLNNILKSVNVIYDTIYNDFQDFISFYDSFSKNNINHWIVEQTMLKVCPYCNISYTYNRKSSVTAQLDHFFPKSEYPALALCFYNLVPSCPSCNRIKHDNMVQMASPYKDNAFHDLRITWELAPNASDTKNTSLKSLEEMIEIKIETPDEYEMNNLIEMKILEAYKEHTDYASEIIKKAEIYANQDAKKLICSFGATLGITPEETERFYLGNYTDKDSLKKRPLSKMTKDILEEILMKSSDKT